MGTWLNSDGLYIRYGADEADNAIGGVKSNINGVYEVEFDLPFSEFDSATPSLPHSTDSFGLVIPKGARIEEIETIILTAFTSSGTVGSATVVLGLKQASDRSTELDHDGFTTSSFTGTAASIATVGHKTFVRAGGTGAGALLGTTLSQNGVLVASNSAHATHPLTAGLVKVRIRYFYP